MKKSAFLIAIAFFIQVSGTPQTCLPDGIVFDTQSQIDNFQTDYPNCTTVEGGVEIIGDDITNLNGLIVLTAVEGYLEVTNTNALVNLSGLDNVTSIGKTLRIYMCNALTSLSGLDNLTSIGGNLRITNNAILTDISALSNLTSIIENLRIFTNPFLTSLSGLDNLAFIGDNLRITGNTALTSLSALSNVTSINGELAVDNNDSLKSLTGLENIDPATITDLVIRNNFSLSICEVTSVCNFLSSAYGDVSLHDNATGCNSTEEVELACETGVADINSESNITIYPNPAEKELFISTANGLIINEVNIYNPEGQKVLHENQTCRLIDVSVLKQGIYIVELVSGNQKSRHKLLIK